VGWPFYFLNEEAFKKVMLVKENEPHLIVPKMGSQEETEDKRSNDETEPYGCQGCW
jgi:hypothetical protein